MSYTKNRVTITTSLEEWKGPDVAKHPSIISGVVTNDKEEVLANVPVDVENLYGSYKKTITTDDKGTFKITIDYSNDVNYLYKIEYHGDAENFGVVKTIPITYPLQHLLSKVAIGHYRGTKPYEKGRHMPGDELTIYPTARDSVSKNHEDEVWISLRNFCSIDCEFNNIKSVIPSMDNDTQKFVIPDVNVDNLNCKLKLTSRPVFYKNPKEKDWYRYCPSARLEYTFDIIVVDKIKLRVIPPNDTKQYKDLVVGLYNLDGSPKQNWRLPYDLKFYVCHVDTNLDEHMFNYNFPEDDYYSHYIESDENGEVFIGYPKREIFNKWQFKPGDYIYAVYPGLVSNKLYLHKNGEWSDVKEDL